MCLVRPWCAGFLASEIADRLSHQSLVGISVSHPQSCTILLSHTIWHAAVVEATYSALVVDKATISCFFELQPIVLMPSRKSNQEVLFRSDTEPPQSLSENASRTPLSSWEYQSPSSLVPARYLATRLAAVKWFLHG